MPNANHTTQNAFNHLCRLDNPELAEEGFLQLKALADAGDMTAAAIVGYSCQFDYHIHYDLDMSRKYLDMAADASNPKGMFYKGTLLMDGIPPYEQNPVLGKWYIQQAAKDGDEEAISALDTRFRERTPEEMATMLKLSAFSLFLWNIWDRITAIFRPRM